MMETMDQELEGVLPPSIDSSERDALFAAGHILYDRGEHERAADVFRFLVVADPLHAASWWALGSCCEQLERLEEAAFMYGNAVRFGEPDPTPALLWVRALLRSGEPQRAAEVLDEIETDELDPTSRERALALRMEIRGDVSC
jgi:Flp pilus assembly protein TadD